MNPHVNKVLVNFHRKQKILFAFVDNLRLRNHSCQGNRQGNIFSV